MAIPSNSEGESLNDLVERTLDRRALPLAARVLRVSKRPKRLALGPTKTSAGTLRRVVLPMFTWDQERISLLLSEICPSEEDQIDKTVPGPILGCLIGKADVFTFDENDVVKRLQPKLKAEWFPWKDKSQWEAVLGNPSVAKVYLDVLYETIQRRKLESESEVIENTYLPDESSRARPLAGMFSAVNLPPNLGQQEYVPLLHPELHGHRLLRRRAWKPKPFRLDDYFDKAQLETASSSGESLMIKTYLAYEPDQQLLLPAALQEWLPDDHLAYFISDVVDQLDMSKVTARYERERRGGPPYHPRMMVKVLLYGYCVGVASSRRIAQRLHEDIAFRVLAANNTPDFRTISDFRKDNVDALSGLFVQVLALCQQAGLVKLGHVALDGTKVKANASKHKAMSYQRMKEKAAQLAAEVAELLRQAQAADDEEDRRYGKDKRGDELPEELAFRERRLEKIREAMAALEAEAQAAAEQAEAEGGKHPGVPDDKAQRNFTDTESRIIPAPGGKDFLQAYNCQAVVDSAHQVIVAARATNQTSDKQQAAAMMEETIDNVGAVPREVSADAGYYSAKAVGELYALGVDPFVAPEQTRHGRVVPPAPRGRIPSHLSPRDRMRRKLQTRRGRQRYALRMQTVEPVFGQIKQGRGFRQFLLRGLEKVNGEWSLICTGHNLLKLFRFGVNLHRKARVDGPAQRIRNFAEVVSTALFAKLSGAGRGNRQN